MAGSEATGAFGPDGWDCHAHVFGPYDRYPLAAQRSYTPPEATPAACTALLGRLGLGRVVLVQPSAYGSDYTLLLDTLAVHPRWRGVLVSANATPATLRSWRAAGIRALRFSHRSAPVGNFAGSALISDLQRLAPAMADAGLHAELWTDTKALPEIAALLPSLPVTVVLDHMAGFDHASGPGAPGFRLLLDLVQRHGVWVKLCAYRNLRDTPDPEVGRDFQRALVAANPEHMLWGSDWPHLNLQPAPATGELMDMFLRWTEDPAVARRVLVDNPGRLYG